MGGMDDIHHNNFNDRNHIQYQAAVQQQQQQFPSNSMWSTAQQNSTTSGGNHSYSAPILSHSPSQYGSSPINTSSNESFINSTKLSSPKTPTISISQSAEHPHGEHPSRTLFVRNINSNVEEHEIKDLFEAYGPTRSIYTQCKHRGFVMVSFYDIRHAKNAIRHLQGRVLRRRKLDIHYSIPRNNPSEKDQNQGTLVVFNLDPSTSREELLSTFGTYGEIKEIRETPNKKHHKFIEFYDVREAEEAMKQLNRTEIKGKKIKIEPSRPGGRKNNGNVSPSSSGSFQRGMNDDNYLHNSSSHSDNMSTYSSSYESPSFPNEIMAYENISGSFSPPAQYNLFPSKFSSASSSTGNQNTQQLFGQQQRGVPRSIRFVKIKTKKNFFS